MPNKPNAATTNNPAPRIFECDNCEGEHRGEYSHQGQYDNREYFAVICDKDYLTDYYNIEWPNRPMDEDETR